MLYVVYRMDRGRMNSVDSQGNENILRDQAELLTSEQAGILMESNHELKSMSEDDWFSY